MDAILVRINRFLSIEAIIILYWSIVWFANGLDKFINRQSLNIFTWFGKDRVEQFSGYFEKTSLSNEWIGPLLILTGVWEFIVGIPFLVAGLLYFARSDRRWNFITLGLFFSAATFAVFAFFDVIFGDRAEFLEHGTFFAIVIVSWLAIIYSRDRTKKGQV